jgi:calmodulin
MSATRDQLSFEEAMRARYVFGRFAEDKIVDEHVLRSCLSEIGQYPSAAELSVCLNAFGRKVNFQDFCKYLSFLKRGFLKPEDRDADTVGAFAALGGQLDKHGNINTDLLRAACQKFALTIDIDAMILAVDDDQSGSIDFGEFKSLWEETEGDEKAGQLFVEEPEEAEVLAQLEAYLKAPDEKKAGLVRQQSVIKRKNTRTQSMYNRDPSRNMSLRLPAISSATQVVEEEEEVEEEPVKEAPPVRQITYDPAYRRYMMTEPTILGEHKKKAPLSARGPAPPNSARKGKASPPRTARKEKREAQAAL